MNRIGFLRQLEELLRDIPDNERREAMEYYRNYFDDAGPQNEEKIIEELGSPAKVAESIKKDLFGDTYRSEDFVKPDPAPRENKTARNLLIALILIFTFPLWIAVFAALFGLCVCVVAVVGVFFVAGVVLAGMGIFQMFSGFASIGLILCGIGLLLLALGMLGVILTVWSVGKLLPWSVRGIVRVIKRMFQRKGAPI